MAGTVHQIRVQEYDATPSLTVLCAGYESGVWRSNQLVEDLFHRHLASFALSFTEYSAINGDTAAAALRKSASAVYSTDKYKRRGEFGELILHAAAKDFFGAQPAVSKIYYKDSSNDTVKGFDCVHVVEVDGDLEIWLGEVKFYAEVRAAVRSVTAEIIDHLSSGFLRSEFTAVTNKLDPAWQHTEAVRNLLDDAKSLDEILPRLVLPVMLTYDSSVIGAHHRVCPDYIDQLRAEARDAWTYFVDELNVAVPVTIHLILVPLDDKEQMTMLMHQKLQVWQAI